MCATSTNVRVYCANLAIYIAYIYAVHVSDCRRCRCRPSIERNWRLYVWVAASNVKTYTYIFIYLYTRIYTYIVNALRHAVQHTSAIFSIMFKCNVCVAYKEKKTNIMSYIFCAINNDQRKTSHHHHLVVIALRWWWSFRVSCSKKKNKTHTSRYVYSGL